ncbi:MAG: BatA domain-containing protein, partial [Pseudomonadota bacterium]
MFGLPLTFAFPWLLAGLISLPVIWWLLRLTPPRPQQEVFPPTRILARLREKEDTPAQSPWWLTLLRLTMAALVILAMAGPILNPQDTTLKGEGPVLLVMDDGWASANDWDEYRNTALAIIDEAERDSRSIVLQSTTRLPVWTTEPVAPEDAASLIQAALPRPLEPAHGETGKAITGLLETTTVGDVVFLSDNIQREGSSDLAESLNGSGASVTVFTNNAASVNAIETVAN